MSRKTWFVVLGLLAWGAVVVFALNRSFPAPQVSFTSLRGEKIAMQDLRGRVTLVNFWATTCTTCLDEMPQIVETYRKYREHGLEVIAVAMSYDAPHFVVQYAQFHALPFKVALDVQGEIARAFGEVQATPTTFVINKEGKIIRRITGKPDFEALQGLIEKELSADYPVRKQAAALWFRPA